MAIDPESAQPSRKPAAWRRSSLTKLLAVGAIIAVLVAFLIPAIRSARPAARRIQCSHNLEIIALALTQYAEAFHALPPAHTVDALGRPLHSWRTLILPYFDSTEFCDSIDLTKPWDDPANAQALATKVPVFCCPELAGPRNLTTYRAIVTPGGAFLPDRRQPLAAITDPHGATLMLIEVDAGHAIPWMQPADADEALVLGLKPDAQLPHRGGVNAAFIDGSVRFLAASLSAPIRRALISIAGRDNAITEEQ